MLPTVAPGWQAQIDFPNNAPALNLALRTFIDSLDTMNPLDRGTFATLWNQVEASLRIRYRQSIATSTFGTLKLIAWRLLAGHFFVQNPAITGDALCTKVFGETDARIAASGQIEENYSAAVHDTDAEAARNDTTAGPRRAQ